MDYTFKQTWQTRDEALKDLTYKEYFQSLPHVIKQVKPKQ